MSDADNLIDEILTKTRNAMRADARHYDNIRPDMLEQLINYVADGDEPCRFLRYALANQLVDAVGAADHYNQWSLAAVACYIYNKVPSIAWGSHAVVNAWLEYHQARKSGVIGEALQAYADKVSDAKEEANKLRVAL